MSWQPDEVRAFFKAHWTVRKYKPVSMPAEHLDAILYAAQRAPTDATAQMYSFVRLVDRPLREKIAVLSHNPHIATASEAFLVCADVHRLAEILKARGKEPAALPAVSIHFAIGDAVMAGQNMLIAAEMLGYRGCWIGGVLSALEEISDLVQLPRGAFLFAALTLGVPDEDAKERPRVPRAQVVHENAYRTPTTADLNAAIDGMAAISARGDWASTLAGYFGTGGVMQKREPELVAYLRRRLAGL